MANPTKGHGMDRQMKLMKIIKVTQMVQTGFQRKQQYATDAPTNNGWVPHCPP